MSDTALIESPRPAPVIYGDVLSIRQITENVARVQTAMESVMKENVHFGTIPGTPKPSLWKPGAEILNMMFRIAVDPDQVDDLSGTDTTGYPFIRYRVRVRFVSQITGVLLGTAWGECSTLEEKYKWRRATGAKEFEATHADRKREKWRRGKQNSEYAEKQVRTEPDDLANTILQMAIKRAEVSGTKRVTACSDIFAQDLEDLPAEIVASIEGEGAPSAPPPDPPKPAERKSQQQPQANGTNPGRTGEVRGGEHVPVHGDEPREAAPRQGASPPYIGKIVAVDEHQANGKTFFSVKLNTGFIATTWSTTVAEGARAHKANGTVVELATRAAKDPKYKPNIEELIPVGREPGSDDA